MREEGGREGGREPKVDFHVVAAERESGVAVSSQKWKKLREVTKWFAAVLLLPFLPFLGQTFGQHVAVFSARSKM